MLSYNQVSNQGVKHAPDGQKPPTPCGNQGQHVQVSARTPLHLKKEECSRNYQKSKAIQISISRKKGKFYCIPVREYFTTAGVNDLALHVWKPAALKELTWTQRAKCRAYSLSLMKSRGKHGIGQWNKQPAHRNPPNPQWSCPDVWSLPWPWQHAVERVGHFHDYKDAPASILSTPSWIAGMEWPSRQGRSSPSEGSMWQGTEGSTQSLVRAWDRASSQSGLRRLADWEDSLTATSGKTLSQIHPAKQLLTLTNWVRQ